MLRRPRQIGSRGAIALMASFLSAGAWAQAPALPSPSECPAGADLPRGHEIVIELLAASTHPSRQGRVDWARQQSDSKPRRSEIRWRQQRTTFYYEADDAHLPYRVTVVTLSSSNAPPATTVLNLTYSEAPATLGRKIEAGDTIYSFEQASDRGVFRAEANAKIAGREAVEIGACRYDAVRRTSVVRNPSNGEELSSIRIQIPSLDISLPVEEISREAGRPPLITRYVPLSIRVSPVAQ